MSHPGEFSLLDEGLVVASSTGEGSFPGWLLAWFGGPRGAVLRFSLGERSLYAGLGTGAFAVGYVLYAPVSRLWPVAMLWGLTLVNRDRLLLLITASKGHLLAMVPRLEISAFLGYLIAEPLPLRIFQPEVGAQAPLQCRWSTVHPCRSADGRGAWSLGRGGTLEHSP